MPTAPAAGGPKKTAARKAPAAKKATAKAAVELPPELTTEDREWVDGQLAVGEEPAAVDASDALVAEVEAEEAVGTEPDDIPPGSVQLFIRRKGVGKDAKDDVLELWAAPVPMWPMSAFRLMNAGIYYAWADEILIPSSLAEFNDFDPTFAECLAMVNEWQAASTVELGKLRASARSSRTTRRR